METKVVKAQKSKTALVVLCIVAAIAIAASLIFLTTTDSGAELAESLGFEKTAAAGEDGKKAGIADNSSASSESADSKTTQSYGYSTDSINEHVDDQRQNLDEHLEESKERFQELIGNN